MLNKQNVLIAILILIGITTRIIPHLDNFTAVYAVALFSGTFLKNKKIAFLLPISIMLFSDLLLGFAPSTPTYISFILIVWLGFSLQKNSQIFNILFSGVKASIIFFLITNFFVWIYSSPVDGIYYCPPTFTGLIKCYMQAIPFLWNTLFSTIFYSIIFIYSFKLINKKLLATT